MSELFLLSKYNAAIWPGLHTSPSFWPILLADLLCLLHQSQCRYIVTWAPSPAEKIHTLKGLSCSLPRACDKYVPYCKSAQSLRFAAIFAAARRAAKKDLQDKANGKPHWTAWRAKAFGEYLNHKARLCQAPHRSVKICEGGYYRNDASCCLLRSQSLAENCASTRRIAPRHLNQ